METQQTFEFADLSLYENIYIYINLVAGIEGGT